MSHVSAASNVEVAPHVQAGLLFHLTIHVFRIYPKYGIQLSNIRFKLLYLKMSLLCMNLGATIALLKLKKIQNLFFLSG